MPNERLKVIDHTTGAIYNSITEAGEALYVSQSTLCFHRKRKGNCLHWNGHDLEFVPTGESKHITAVRCIETNIVYPSVKSAASAIGVYPQSMSHHLSGKRKSIKKLHFRREES